MIKIMVIYQYKRADFLKQDSGYLTYNLIYEIQIQDIKKPDILSGLFTLGCALYR